MAAEVDTLGELGTKIDTSNHLPAASPPQQTNGTIQHIVVPQQDVATGMDLRTINNSPDDASKQFCNKTGQKFNCKCVGLRLFLFF